MVNYTWKKKAPVFDNELHYGPPRESAVATTATKADGKQYGYIGFGNFDQSSPEALPGHRISDLMEYDPEGNSWAAVWRGDDAVILRFSLKSPPPLSVQNISIIL